MSDSSPAPRGAVDLLRSLRNGDELLLVCAYQAAGALPKFPLQGALTLSELVQREAGLARDTELVFFCWCPADKTSRQAAQAWRARGFTRATWLEGGVAAWRSAGGRFAR